MNFDEALNRYWQLRARYEAGTLDADAFESAIKEMQVQDAHGNLWQLGVQSAAWYRLENGTWVEDSPPGRARQTANTGAQHSPPTQSVNQVQTGSFSSKRGKPWMIIFAVIASILVIVCCVLVVLLPGLNTLLTPSSTIIDTNPSNENLPSFLPSDNPPVPTRIQPTTAPVIPTTTQTEAPHSQEASPEPTIYNFITCTAPCSDNPASQQSSFPEGTTRLYLRFNYDWIPPGSDYVRLWKNGGQEWVRYQCKWDGPESGVFESDIKEPGGFRSGEWAMEIYVDGKLISQQAYTVKGDSNYWEPAGTIYGCK